jgi:hypothetical protein
VDLGRVARAQALVERGVLAVDGHDLAATLRSDRGDDGAAGDEALLVGQREALAVLERRERGREPGEADDRVQHDIDVGMRGELGEHRGVVTADACALGCDPELRGLRGEQLGVATGGERHHLVLVAVAPDDVERLGADGAGGAEDRDAAGRPVGPHQVMPSATTR